MFSCLHLGVKIFFKATRKKEGDLDKIKKKIKQNNVSYFEVLRNEKYRNVEVLAKSTPGWPREQFKIMLAETSLVKLAAWMLEKKVTWTVCFRWIFLLEVLYEN